MKFTQKSKKTEKIIYLALFILYLSGLVIEFSGLTLCIKPDGSSTIESHVIDYNSREENKITCSCNHEHSNHHKTSDNQKLNDFYEPIPLACTHTHIPINTGKSDSIVNSHQALARCRMIEDIINIFISLDLNLSEENHFVEYNPPPLDTFKYRETTVLQT